jgi:hypothetical protein
MHLIAQPASNFKHHTTQFTGLLTWVFGTADHVAHAAADHRITCSMILGTSGACQDAPVNHIPAGLWLVSAWIGEW